MLSAVNSRLTLNVGGTNKPLSGSLQRRRYTYRVYDHGIGNYITRSRNTNEPEFRCTVAKDGRETNGASIAADNTLTLGLDCRPATAAPDQDDKEDTEDSVILSPRTLTFTITDDDARGVTVDADPLPGFSMPAPRHALNQEVNEKLPALSGTMPVLTSWWSLRDGRD